MARIKYNIVVKPVQGKHYGFTFQRNHYGQSMQPSARNSGTRTPLQLLRMQNIQKAIRHWRDMTPEAQASWETFATNYPVSSKRDPAVLLTGYQLFIKRNHYCFLNLGLDIEFLTSPEMVSLPEGAPVFTIQAGENVVDVTETYLARFGQLPNLGQKLEFLAIPYSETSGQFFPVIHTLLDVLAVYVDGLFLSIDMPVVHPNISYSVYLSKPVSEGYTFPGTNYRYMGCFTTKSFLGLSDTPNSYAGQAGKTPIVKVDETGLEWGSGGGGGLTCADLPACPTIINIESQIYALALALTGSGDASVPAINLGYLYNFYAATSPLQILSSDEWRIPTKADWDDFRLFCGASGGAALKINVGSYWVNKALNNNAKKYNSMGGGRRTYLGTFGQIGSFEYFWSSSWSYGDYYWALHFNDAGMALNYSNAFRSSGYAIRPRKVTTTLSEGGSGVYFGNNGYIYRTICIGGVEYLADNLAETHFRDGSAIPVVTVQATWAALTSPGCCAYNNLSSYILK